MGRLRLGTSSWSERAWDGVFYPAGLAAIDQLPFYSRRFTTVEADVTYYRVPDRRMVQSWADRTPDHFTLSAKFPRSIVHGGESTQPDPTKILVHASTAADLARFLDAMSLLGPKCGPLVLQFPYFNQRAFKTSEPFRERLDAFLAALPPTFRYGVELRNKSWIDEPMLALLRKHRTALVLVDLAYMPHPADLAQRFDLVTTDFAYARLIGDRKQIDALTDKLDHTVLDQSARLARWAELVRELLNRVREVYVYANNHYAGYAPDTIADLAARVEGASPP